MQRWAARPQRSCPVGTPPPHPGWTPAAALVGHLQTVVSWDWGTKASPPHLSLTHFRGGGGVGGPIMRFTTCGSLGRTPQFDPHAPHPQPRCCLLRCPATPSCGRGRHCRFAMGRAGWTAVVKPVNQRVTLKRKKLLPLSASLTFILTNNYILLNSLIINLLEFIHS